MLRALPAQTCVKIIEVIICVRKLCIPPFSEDPRLMQELIEYCEQDVRTMRAASQAMRELTDDELADYHINERINDRGVMVDVPLCQAAVKIRG